MKEKTYIAIDLKSFYASQECVERGTGPVINPSGGGGCQPDGKRPSAWRLRRR